MLQERERDLMLRHLGIYCTGKLMLMSFWVTTFHVLLPEDIFGNCFSASSFRSRPFAKFSFSFWLKKIVGGSTNAQQLSMCVTEETPAYYSF